jgi:ketosteroid isomerase-like protein
MSERRPSSRSDDAHSESASGPSILRWMRNIEIDSLVRRYYELVDENRLEDLLSLFAEDTIYRRPGYEPLQGKGMLRHFYSVEREISEGEHHIHQVMIDGRSAAVEGHFVGFLKSGIDVTVRFADFFQLSQDRLIAKRDTYFYVPSI